MRPNRRRAEHAKSQLRCSLDLIYFCISSPGQQEQSAGLSLGRPKLRENLGRREPSQDETRMLPFPPLLSSSSSSSSCWSPDEPQLISSHPNENESDLAASTGANFNVFRGSITAPNRSELAELWGRIISSRLLPATATL